jgi:hypothetical protein
MRVRPAKKSRFQQETAFFIIGADLRVVPFAGITQIRFQGYILRPDAATPTLIELFLNPWQFHVKRNSCLSIQPAVGIHFDH